MAPKPAVASDAAPGIGTWINADYPAARTTGVAAAPSEDAVVLSQLRQGAQVRVVGLVAGTQWLKIRLPDDSVGYVPAASIPAATGLATATAAPVRSEIAGATHVRDTATLVVDGQRVRLFGISGLGGPSARAMQGFIDAQGGRLDCQPQAQWGYRCTLPSGADVAEFALVNGAARITPGAPDAYRLQEDAARGAPRGLWQGAAPPPEVAEAPPPEVLLLEPAPPPDADFTVVDGQPEVEDAGVAELLVYSDDDGWGYWDHGHRWHGAPGPWAHRLEHMYPRGAGLRAAAMRERLDHGARLLGERGLPERDELAGREALAKRDMRPAYAAPDHGRVGEARPAYDPRQAHDVRAAYAPRPAMPMPFHGPMPQPGYAGGGAPRPGMPAHGFQPQPAGFRAPAAAHLAPARAPPARCHGKGC